MRGVVVRLLTMLLVSGFATGVVAPASAAPGGDTGDIRDALERVPGLTVVAEQDAPEGFRFFTLTFTQPADHRDPAAGTFQQRLTLLHRDVDAPMVMYTSGYNVNPEPVRSEPTRLVDGNQLSMEYRYFAPSIPQRKDWPRQLTIRQAAIDQHRIATAFKSIYQAHWLATGASKGGMTATYFARFYPRDVDGTIPYVAPNDVINSIDAYRSFLARVGPDPRCRRALREVQRDALLRRDELGAIAAREADKNGYTFNTVGSLDTSLELAVVDSYFTFWQYLGPADCASIPAPGASAAKLYDFFESTVSLVNFADQNLEYLFPYYYQAAVQLGSYEAYDGYLRDLLRYPGKYVPETFVPDSIPLTRFDHHAMPDIDAWVRTRGQRLLFVYGEYDPWSAEPFEPGPGTRDSYRYYVPGGNHGATIAQLPKEQAAEATATVRRWAGLGGTAAKVHRPADAPPGFDADPLLTRRPKL